MAKLGVFGKAKESSAKAQDSRRRSLEGTDAKANQPSLLHTNWPGFRTVWPEPSFWPENTVEVARTPMLKLTTGRGGHCMQNPREQGQTDHGERQGF